MGNGQNGDHLYIMQSHRFDIRVCFFYISDGRDRRVQPTRMGDIQ
jgi:hypothetical protein